LLKTGWLIPVDDDDYEFSTHLSWFAKVRLNKIYEHMEKAYSDVKADIEGYLRWKARNDILAYDMDKVFEKYWVPMLKQLEEAKNTPEKYPNWKKEIYPNISGRIYPAPGDCGEFHCANCDKQCDKLKLFRFQSEPLDEARSLMMRSYPLFPNKNLKEMFIDLRCPMAKWVGERFINEVNTAWDKVVEYPELRKFYKDKWAEGYFSKFIIEKLKDRDLNFSDEYSKVFSLPWTSAFKVNDEVTNFLEGCEQVLEVGSGEGKTLRALSEKGFKVKGIEINKDRIDGNMIIFGDATNIPFGDKTIDAVITVDVLEHLDDPIKALREIFRVARKKVIIQVTSLNSTAFGEDPTHKVKWQDYRWWREIAEFGKVVKRNGQRFYVEVVN
jgi:2-polyprenyl-3-methyl-5-hydroxy-6-metoxy-1,4-benzoquinol methylase